MTITASAPGKLLLLGEYAVLHGAPALVMAVNRRARAKLAPAAGYSVSAPHMDRAPEAFTLAPDGTPEWGSAEAAERFRLLDHILRSRHGAVPAPFSAVLDTNAFFHRGPDGTHKLGLGSSAALTVALAGALNAHAGDGPPAAAQAFPALLETHRALQGGQGSGFDVAAALYGGILGFRLNEDRAEVEELALPDDLHTLCVWSGKSAATGGLVARVNAWRQRENQSAATLFGTLSDTARSGVEAARRGDTASLLDAVRHYSELLVRLGDASETDIVSAEHCRISDLAAEAGAAYKPCGAGGGDVGMVFSDNSASIKHLREVLESAGFGIVPLDTDQAGLQVET